MNALSKNNTAFKIALPVIVSILAYTIVSAYINEPIISIIAVLMSIIWVYRIYTRSFNIYYSKDHLILKSRNTERNIHLSNIKRVKLTLSDMRIMGSQYYQYNIDFTNELGLFESQSFYVSNVNSSLWEFQDLIKSKNPDSIIENHASSMGN